MSQIKVEVAGSYVEALFGTQTQDFVSVILDLYILYYWQILYLTWIELNWTDFMVVLCVNASTVLVFPSATDQELGWLNTVMTRLWAG